MKSPLLKIMALLLCLVMLFVLFAGCGQKPEEADT